MKEKAQTFIRYQQALRFEMAEPAAVLPLIREHRDSLPFTGDNFMAALATRGEPFLILSPGEKSPLGVFIIKDKVHLGLGYIRPPYKYLDREIMEAFLSEFNIHYGFAASFDHHLIPLYLAFQARTELQAYQFELLHPDLLPRALPGLRLDLARAEDTAYMDRMAFLTNSSAYIRREEAWIARNETGQPVGIGVIQPHLGKDDRLDIGMFVNPGARGQGYGRSILIRLMEICLKTGRLPVAGCYHKNYESRRTLESAGMTCIGTIFRFSFDPGRFR